MFEFTKNNLNAVSFGGISITQQRTLDGYNFSFPTFRAGLSMIVKGRLQILYIYIDEKLNMQFMTPLTLEFISILLATVIGTSILLYLFEGGDTIWEFLYIQLSNLFYSGGGFHKFAPRLIICVFWCLTIFIIETYIAIVAEIFMNHTGGRSYFH